MGIKTSPHQPRIVGLILFLGLGAGIEWYLSQCRDELDAAQKANTALLGENTRIRLQQELNAAALASNALADYWTVRRTAPDTEEIRNMLAYAYRHGRHVRSIAIAIGTRIAQVFPQDDEFQTAGSDYRDRPMEWLPIQHAIQTHSPVLAPDAPPARGISYRVPIFLNGQYLGLLSTRIDVPSLVSAADLGQPGYEYALKLSNESGLAGDLVFGTAELFGDPKASVAKSAVSGGRLTLAIKSMRPSHDAWNEILRGLGWLLAALFAAQAVALLKLKRKLSGLAPFDALTGLPSKHLFLDRLKQTMRRTKRNHGNFSVLYIDLNNFKSVNSSHDVKVGDMMLAGIGKRLLGSIRHCDTVTRWGGDEFLILLDACPLNQAQLIAENLRHKIELPVAYGDIELRIGASIGLATYPEDGYSLAALLKIADARMHKDKARRKP